MVERNKEGIEIANKRSLRIYIRKTYDARIDGEEEGVHLEKTYIIQFLKGINEASIAGEAETTNAQDEDANKNEDPAAKTNVGDANE